MSKKTVPMVPGPVQGEFCHAHKEFNCSDNDVLFKCTGKYECFFCGMNEAFWNAKNNLLGEILTIVDTAITDERQNKAMKDMIRDRVIWRFSDHQNTCESLLGKGMLDPQESKKNA